ncbi:hypothetical protein ID858_15830 [Xenorhabdus sp. DI]|uniref:hypothetical protein n=1 Tax=Xenorhabdus doucetiae TaxID=351671 RepID=UPI0019BB0BF4|nr:MULTISPECIES: hypothetical protein [unclassified Xenorhabdus]MBD2786197.1 hypothetical protein [Xenorhabdus sp. 3]MBD2789967.1 hypothetical protein [Xenorhabdus sp. DI]MBD2798430.1 hypothetical protein [Xenorhabdus sp. 18]
MKRRLGIVLDVNSSFEDLVYKVSQAFNISLSIKDDKGRYIATGNLTKYKITVVDKEDRQSELLCDEHYTLELDMENENDNYEYESEILNILFEANIKWIKGVWNALNKQERYKIIHPDTNS